MSEPANQNEDVVQTVDEKTKKILSSLEQIYVNKFYIGWGKEGIVRLTFADIVDESNEDTNKLIATFLMTPAGLMSLKLMIDNFVAMKQQPPAEQSKERETLN